MINEDTPSGYIERPTKGFSSFFTDIEDLGCHGFNHLYKAKRNGKLFILKSLSDDLKESVDFQLVLQKEFELASAIDHPNIVKVHYLEDVAEIGWCIVMDCIDGVTLSEFLKEKHPAKVYDKIVSELLDAMGYLHSKQIIHADLKPSNVMVTHNGNFVKLIDFGLSDADHYAELKNHACTECYASPEQKNGEKLNCRSDIYSFGKILQAGFPKKYQSIARKCTRLNPDRRFQNTTEIQEAIRRKNITGFILRIATIILAISVVFFIADKSIKSEKPKLSEIKSDTTELTVAIANPKTDSIMPQNNVRQEKSDFRDTQLNKKDAHINKKVENDLLDEAFEEVTIENDDYTEEELEYLNNLLDNNPPPILRNKSENEAMAKEYEKHGMHLEFPAGQEDNNTPKPPAPKKKTKKKFSIVENGNKYRVIFGLYDTVTRDSYEYIEEIYHGSSSSYYLAKKDGLYGTFHLKTDRYGYDTIIMFSSAIDFKYDEIRPLIYTDTVRGEIWNLGGVVRLDGKYGYASQFNNYSLSLKCEYDEIIASVVGNLECLCTRINDKWGLYVPMMAYLKCEYDEPPIYYNEEILLVKDGMTGVIDVLGREVLPFIYKCYKPSEGIIKVKKGGKYAFIIDNPDFNKNPKVLAEALESAKYKYDNANSFHNGKALVEKKRRKFYITKDDVLRSN